MRSLHDLATAEAKTVRALGASPNNCSDWRLVDEEMTNPVGGGSHSSSWLIKHIKLVDYIDGASL